MVETRDAAVYLQGSGPNTTTKSYPVQNVSGAPWINLFYWDPARVGDLVNCHYFLPKCLK